MLMKVRSELLVCFTYSVRLTYSVRKDYPNPNQQGTQMTNQDKNAAKSQTMGSTNKTMQAVRRSTYGTPDVLRIDSVPVPTPANDSIVVKVVAASVNPLDWHFMTGTPYLVRLQGGATKPKVQSLGVDFSGVVDAVGEDVTEFAAGDEVFGGGNGTFAEYVKVKPQSIIAKPTNLSFEQAAAVPIAAFTALQALTKAGLKSGDKVLVNGASGGVGTFAVQIAKAAGAEVTGVCSGRNVEMVKGIGADHVIDYQQDDFTAGAERYDIMIDNIGNKGLTTCKRLLTPEGAYVMVGGPKKKFLGPILRLLWAVTLFMFSKKNAIPVLANQTKEDLEKIRDLLASGEVVPVVGRTYSLSETAAALTELGGRHAQGKIVIVP